MPDSWDDASVDDVWVIGWVSNQFITQIEILAAQQTQRICLAFDGPRDSIEECEWESWPGRVCSTIERIARPDVTIRLVAIKHEALEHWERGRLERPFGGMAVVYTPITIDELQLQLSRWGLSDDSLVASDERFGRPDLAREIVTIASTEGCSKSLREDIATFVHSHANSTAPVVCVGPTKAGKSTLVNAIFGSVVVPSGVLPETVLPCRLLGSDQVNCYELRADGEGLCEFLWGEDQAEHVGGLLGLSSKQAFEKLRDINRMFRVAMSAESLRPEHFRRTYPRFAEWVFEVTVPLKERLPYTFIDCPGGSEHGLLGDAIQAFLQHQVGKACLALLVTRADNVAPLTDSLQVVSFFGGRVDKDVIVVVNAVEKRETKEGAKQLLETQGCLQALRVANICYISAQTILAQGIVDATLGGPQEKDAQALAMPSTIPGFLRMLGLTHFEGRFREEGYEDMQTILSLSQAELLEALERDVGMQRKDMDLVVRALQGSVEGQRIAELPAQGDEGFERRRHELALVFESVYPALSFDEKYSGVRRDLPRLVRKGFDAIWSDNAWFAPYFRDYVARERTQLLQNFLLQGSIQIAREELDHLRSALQSSEEAERDPAVLEGTLAPEKVAGLKVFIRNQVDGLEELVTSRQKIEEATRLFGGTGLRMTEGSIASDVGADHYLTADDVERVMDEKMAVAFWNNVNWADKAGRKNVLEKATGRDARRFGRLLTSADRAIGLAQAFQTWCMDSIVNARVTVGISTIEDFNGLWTKVNGSHRDTLRVDAGRWGLDGFDLDEQIVRQDAGWATNDFHLDMDQSHRDFIKWLGPRGEERIWKRQKPQALRHCAIEAARLWLCRELPGKQPRLKHVESAFGSKVLARPTMPKNDRVKLKERASAALLMPIVPIAAWTGLNPADWQDECAARTFGQSQYWLGEHSPFDSVKPLDFAFWRQLASKAEDAAIDGVVDMARDVAVVWLQEKRLEAQAHLDGTFEDRAAALRLVGKTEDVVQGLEDVFRQLRRQLYERMD